MTSREIQKKVREFKRIFGLLECNYLNLKVATEKQGYTVIEYNHIFNNDDVQVLIDELKLEDKIIRSRGFTYADKNYRLVFIHEDLSEQEKIIILAHEIGHIFLEHLSSGMIIGKDVMEEYVANEFSHYLLKKSRKEILVQHLYKYKKIIICMVMALIISICGIGIFKWLDGDKKNNGEYYTTVSGYKYHKKDCIFVRDKTNVHKLTDEEFEKGEYEPCQVCLPD